MSALRDQIKKLELENEEKSQVIEEMRARGHTAGGKMLHSYRFNPTFSRQKKSEIEMARIKRELAELKQAQGKNHYFI